MTADGPQFPHDANTGLMPDPPAPGPGGSGGHGGHGGRAAWLAGGAVVTILAIGGTAMGIWLGTGARALTHSATQTASYTGTPTRIVLRIGSGDITIKPGPAGRITERKRLQWASGRPLLTEHWDRHVLDIAQHCPGGFLGSNCGVSFWLTVPPGVAVSATTASGDIVVGGITGTLTLESSSGNVTAAGPVANVSASTASGDVSVTGARSADIVARSASGNVSLAFTAAPSVVNADTASGDVHVIVPPGASYDVQAAGVTTSPAVSVSRSASSPRLIVAHSMSGDVTVSNG